MVWIWKGRSGYERLDLSSTIVVAMDELSCPFTVIYQRRLHFGTRAGLLGPTTGQRRSSLDPLLGWIHHKLALGSKKLAIEREDCCFMASLYDLHFTRSAYASGNLSFCRDTIGF